MSCTKVAEIPADSSITVRLVAPTDVLTDDPLDFTDDGSTASFRVYDPLESTILIVAAASPDVVLSVADTGVFLVGDIVELNLDDGTVHSSTIVGVDSVVSTVTIADPVPSAAAVGSRFRVRLGPSVVMLEYGTPVAGKRDWGFQGVLASDHPGVDPGRLIAIEISFVGGVGDDLDLLKVICAQVSGGAADCP